MKKIITLVFVSMVMLPFTTFAQKITLGGQMGWAVPQGNAFENSKGEKMSKGGLDFDFDLLYHLESYNNKLAVGITYNTSILFGASLSDENVDFGMYGHTLYGLKGYYKFFDSKVSPYASLSLGASQLATPEITSGDVVIAESKKAYSLGIKPEIGLHLGGFIISLGYFVPMKYKIADEKLSAGSLQISIGGRFKLYGSDN